MTVAEAQPGVAVVPTGDDGDLALHDRHVGPLVALSSGALAAASLIPGLPTPLKALLVAPLVLVGIGSAMTWYWRFPRSLLVGVIPALGISSAILLSTVLTWLHAYSPTTTTSVLSALTVASGVSGLYKGFDLRSIRENVRRVRLPVDVVRAKYFVLAAIAGVWVVALVGARGSDIGLWGPLMTGPGLVLTASMVAAAVFTLWRIIRADHPAAMVGIAATIVMIRAPASLLSSAPLYSWTYKHIGLSDFISTFHSIPSGYIDIYSRWPGFFVGAAWLSSASGLGLITIAHWFALATHFLLAACVWSLARALHVSTSASLGAVLIAEVLNWVGQDYFSPQAVAMVLAVAVIALFAASREHPAAAVFALPMFSAITIAHQLTPVWLLAIGVAMTALNRIRPLWLVPACCVVWLGFVGPRASSVLRYGLFTGSNPLANAQTNVSGAAGASTARSLTEMGDRLLALLVWGGAVIAFVYLWRKHRHDFALLVITFSPVLLLAGQSYGGEAIFRVFLYSTVGAAIIVAVAGEEMLTRSRHRRPVSAAMYAILAATTVVSLNGYYGGWLYNTVTPTQIALSRDILARVDSDSTIVTLVPAGWPERSTADYARIAAVNPLYDSQLDDLEKNLTRGDVTTATMRALDHRASLSGGAFLIVIPTQAYAYDDYFGYFHPNALRAFVLRLSEDPRWRIAHNDDNTVVFQYEGSLPEVGHPR